MHPSLQAKYGLRSEEDVAIADRAIAHAKKAGWTDAQVNGLLQFYATLAPALERGQLAPEAALHQLWDFAELQGVGAEQRGSLLDWHGNTVEYIDAHDGELPPLPKASAATVREEIAELEKIQRDDPNRYWADETLQSKYYDLLSQSRGDAAPPIATKSHIKRLGELEKLMGDPNSAYWRPTTGPALQAEYRNILNMGAPESHTRAPAPTSQPSARRAEIEKMVGNQNSDYWRGTQANQIQNEYREILSLAAPSGAAATPGDAGTATQGDQ